MQEGHRVVNRQVRLRLLPLQRDGQHLLPVVEHCVTQTLMNSLCEVRKEQNKIRAGNERKKYLVFNTTTILLQSKQTTTHATTICTKVKSTFYMSYNFGFCFGQKYK